jgi:uncharacterized protein YukE
LGAPAPDMINKYQEVTEKMGNTSSGNFQDMDKAHDSFLNTFQKCAVFIGEVEREKFELEKIHKGDAAKTFGGKLDLWLTDMTRVRDSLGRMTEALQTTKKLQVGTQAENSDAANSIITSLDG